MRLAMVLCRTQLRRRGKSTIRSVMIIIKITWQEVGVGPTVQFFFYFQMDEVFYFSFRKSQFRLNSSLTLPSPSPSPFYVLNLILTEWKVYYFTIDSSSGSWRSSAGVRTHNPTLTLAHSAFISSFVIVRQSRSLANVIGCPRKPLL